MAGTANGVTPLSPTSTTTSLFAANRRVQQMEEIFGLFATQINAEMQTIVGRVATLESTLRRREEEIQAAFDVTAARMGS